MSVGIGFNIIKSKILPPFRMFFTKAFSKKYLLATNLTLSVSLSGVGDIIEQNYEIMTKEIDQFNSKRTRNMSISGLSLGLVCHYWYHYLDRFLPGYTLRVAMKKLVLDQFIASPLCIATFFLTLGYLEGTSKEEFIKETKQKAIKLYVADWMVWPPAQFINFYLLPYQYRVLFDNTISLGYDIYTSRVKHEDEEAKGVHLDDQVLQLDTKICDN